MKSVEEAGHEIGKAGAKSGNQMGKPMHAATGGGRTTPSVDTARRGAERHDIELGG